MVIDKKQAALNAKFLNAWQGLESAVRASEHMTVQGLETHLADTGLPSNASGLRMCRQVRNFLVHDGEYLVGASENMCVFLYDMTNQVKAAGGTAKDMMMSLAKYGCITMSQPISKAAAALLAKKHSDVVVLNEDGSIAGIFAMAALATALRDGYGDQSVATGYKSLLKPPTAIHGTTPMTDAPAMKCIVLDNKGRPAGVLNPDKEWTWD